MFIKPSTQKVQQTAFQRALEELKFGSIVVNGPAMLCYATTSLSWGAFHGKVKAESSDINRG